MFDLHNHILPGIDDGARDMAEALALLQLAKQQGISHMLVTPHLHLGHYDNNVHIIARALDTLVQQAAAANISIKLAAAAEVRIGGEILPLIERGQLPFIGRYQGANVLLLELPHSHIPAGTDKLLAWLQRNNIVAMLAHPERNRELLAQPDKINSLNKAGCLFQLTAGAVLGDMGADVKALSQRWLRQDLYHIVASDTHSVKRRPPRLKLAYQYISETLSAETADLLCITQPAQLAAPVFDSGMLLS